jgi:hypothetical protein
MGVKQTENPVADASVIQAVPLDVEAVDPTVTAVVATDPIDGAIVIGGGGASPVVVAAVVAEKGRDTRRRALGVAVLLGVACVFFLAGSSTPQAVDSEDGDTHFGTARPEREPTPPYPVQAVVPEEVSVETVGQGEAVPAPEPALVAVVAPEPTPPPPPPARPPRVDPCAAGPCLNGGHSFAGRGAEFMCSCATGFHGDTCEVAEVNGCTDVEATNFNPLATHDDGSCVAPVRRNPCDAEPCLNGGACTPGQHETFWCACGSGYSGSTCEVQIVWGCTDEGASNYDSVATRDDGSCVVPPPPRDCVGVWSECAADCADRRFTVLQEPVGAGALCEAADQATAACSPGEGSCNLRWELLGGSITAENALHGGNMVFYGEYSTFEPDTPWPGGRSNALTWPCEDGVTTYVFGGYGRGEAAYHSQSWMNDLWSVRHNTSESSDIAWTFVSGSRRTNDNGQYTSMHTAGGVPRSRGFSQGWSGAGNTGWMFGGQTWGGGSTALLDDLWQISLADGQWTWRGGRQTSSQETPALTRAAAEGLAPSPRTAHGATAIGTDGSAYIFGGYGQYHNGQVGLLNDLWQFDPAQATADASGTPWTPMAAGSTTPSQRATHAMWMHGETLWMHGGESSAGFLADLWTFDATRGAGWEIVQSTAAGAHGIYGADAPPQRGESLRAGARHRQTVWPDKRDSSTIWMMGGEGHDVNGQTGWLDDVWRLRLSEPASASAQAEWEWVGGSAIAAGYAAPLQWGPSGRASVSVLNGGTDEAGRVALFGGYRIMGRASEVLNDLWQLDTAP